METYRVRLAGEALPGHTPESIAEALLRQLKLRPTQVQTMLPPARRVVKAGLNHDEADHLHQILTLAGLAAHKEKQAVTADIPSASPAATSATSSPAAATATTADPLSDLVTSLARGFPRRRPSPGYALRLVLVTLCCVLIPLLYLAMVTLFGYGLVWYLWHVHDFTSFHVRGFWPMFVLYALPGASGALLLLFLLRPMLPMGATRERSLLLDPGEEPRLLQAIHRLAEAIGIRPPVALRLSNEVNASVHFEGGWAGFFNGRKVLTIGLPLVAGLSSQQFLGVLAHEFGHFAQRLGMRCSFLINHVNAWLYQRAHRPDPWVERLEQWAHENDEFVVRTIMIVTRAGIGGSRLLLAGLFQLSFRLSQSLSRQMEFDADRYEAVLAGSTAFGDTALRLRALARAFGEVDKRNASTWREHKLLRDMPQAVAAQVDGYDTSAWATLRRGLGYGTTRYWDSHPADLERIRHAQSLQAPGMFSDARPAAVLFDRFVEHCRDATRAYYRLLGVDFRNAELCDTEIVTRLGAQRDDAHSDMRRWTGRQWHARPWLPLQRPLPDDLGKLSWQACIDELRLHSPAITQDWAKAEQEAGRRARIAFAGLLERHGIPFPLSRVEGFDEQRHLPEYQRIIDWQTPSRQALLRTAGLYRRRIELALRAANLRHEPLFALSTLYADVESLQEAWIVASQFEGTGDVAQHKGLERIRQDAMIACQEHSLRLLRKCDDIPQSLLDGDSIGGYLRRRCPRAAQPSDGPTEFVAIAGTLLDSLGHAYRLAFSTLAQRCAQAERAHGIAGIEN